MAHSDSEDEVEGIDDLDFDARSSDVDGENDEDVFKMDGEDDADEATEAEDVRHPCVHFKNNFKSHVSTSNSSLCRILCQRTMIMKETTTRTMRTRTLNYPALPSRPDHRCRSYHP